MICRDDPVGPLTTPQETIIHHHSTLQTNRWIFDPVSLKSVNVLSDGRTGLRDVNLVKPKPESHLLLDVVHVLFSGIEHVTVWFCSGFLNRSRSKSVQTLSQQNRTEPCCREFYIFKELLHNQTTTYCSVFWLLVFSSLFFQIKSRGSSLAALVCIKSISHVHGGSSQDTSRTRVLRRSWRSSWTPSVTALCEKTTH